MIPFKRVQKISTIFLCLIQNHHFITNKIIIFGNRNPANIKCSEDKLGILKSSNSYSLILKKTSSKIKCTRFCTNTNWLCSREYKFINNVIWTKMCTHKLYIVAYFCRKFMKLYTLYTLIQSSQLFVHQVCGFLIRRMAQVSNIN